MRISQAVRAIIRCYDGEIPALKTHLSRLLMHGKLGGTGKMIILPVDQGFEHGPDRSFAMNVAAYNPLYHAQLACDAGLNAYAAPLGMLEAVADPMMGAMPLILKMNSSNSLTPASLAPNQAVTASVRDAIRLGCVGVGLTIYPGSGAAMDMMEEAREIVREAKSYGLVVVIWSYPRGEALDKSHETALDITAYAAHMAALLGAHIIKVKPPTALVAQASMRSLYQSQWPELELSLSARIAHIMRSTFDGRRLVLFSGGASKSTDALLEEVRAIADGGGTGSIVGRNSFQRPRDEALTLLSAMISLLKERRP